MADRVRGIVARNGLAAIHCGETFAHAIAFGMAPIATARLQLIIVANRLYLYLPCGTFFPVVFV